MRKTILKNVAILTFALFGMGIIGHNVAYAITEPIHEGGDSGCDGNYCEWSGWFSSCSACCGEYMNANCGRGGCGCSDH